MTCSKASRNLIVTMKIEHSNITTSATDVHTLVLLLSVKRATA